MSSEMTFTTIVAIIIFVILIAVVIYFIIFTRNFSISGIGDIVSGIIDFGKVITG